MHLNAEDLTLGQVTSIALANINLKNNKSLELR